MCNKCSELDKKIEHLEILAQRVLDQMTTDGIAELVRELRDEKKSCIRIRSDGRRPWHSRSAVNLQLWN